MSYGLKSRRLLLVNAIQLSQGGTGSPYVLVDRLRTRKLDLKQLPATSLYPGEEAKNTDDSHGRALRTLDWRLAIRCVGDDTVLDPLIAWSVRAALTDPSFGDIAVDTVELGIEWIMEEGTDAILTGADVLFRTTYYTDVVDMESEG